MAATGAIQIGELSRRTGCNIETIRYYERIGLLAPPRRGRYRSYGREGRGSPGLRAPREGAGLYPGRGTRLARTCGWRSGLLREVRELAASHLKDVRARIADLKRMERVLADSVRACDAGRDPGCPLLDTLGAEVRVA